MTKKDVHVVPHKDGWATKKEGASRAGTGRTPKNKRLSGHATKQSVSMSRSSFTDGMERSVTATAMAMIRIRLKIGSIDP